MSHWELAEGKTNEWYTPEYVFNALGERFDLDVASPPEGPRHVPCDWYLSENSLDQEWFGFIWMNPPFGKRNTLNQWLSKFIDHGQGIALVPDRTSSPWFQDFCSKVDLLCFVRSRIRFERPDGSRHGSPACGIAFLALGDRAISSLKRSNLGMCVCPTR